MSTFHFQVAINNKTFFKYKIMAFAKETFYKQNKTKKQNQTKHKKHEISQYENIE